MMYEVRALQTRCHGHMEEEGLSDRRDGALLSLDLKCYVRLGHGGRAPRRRVGVGDGEGIIRNLSLVSN